MCDTHGPPIYGNVIVVSTRITRWLIRRIIFSFRNARFFPLLHVSHMKNLNNTFRNLTYNKMKNVQRHIPNKHVGIYIYTYISEGKINRYPSLTFPSADSYSLSTNRRPHEQTFASKYTTPRPNVYGYRNYYFILRLLGQNYIQPQIITLRIKTKVKQVNWLFNSRK